MWLVERYLIAPRHSILNCIKTRRRPHYTHAFKALITQHDTHTRARCGINVRQPVSCYLLWSKKQTSLSNLELISHLKSKHCSCKLKRNYIENAVNPTEKITSEHWIRSTVLKSLFSNTENVCNKSVQRTQSTGLKTNNYFGLFEKERKKWSNQIGAATVRQKTSVWDVRGRCNGRSGGRRDVIR